MATVREEERLVERRLHVMNVLEHRRTTQNTAATNTTYPRPFDAVDGFFAMFPTRRVLPSGTNGYVYALISAMNPTELYFGQCKVLRRRLVEQHNGTTAHPGGTDPSFRPWLLLMFIHGPLDFGILDRLRVEAQWEGQFSALPPAERNLERLATIGIQVAHSESQTHHHLRGLLAVPTFRLENQQPTAGEHPSAYRRIIPSTTTH
jgi:hypothetical protein